MWEVGLCPTCFTMHCFTMHTTRIGRFSANIWRSEKQLAGISSMEFEIQKQLFKPASEAHACFPIQCSPPEPPPNQCRLIRCARTRRTRATAGTFARCSAHITYAYSYYGNSQNMKFMFWDSPKYDILYLLQVMGEFKTGDEEIEWHIRKHSSQAHKMTQIKIHLQ